MHCCCVCFGHVEKNGQPEDVPARYSRIPELLLYSVWAIKRTTTNNGDYTAVDYTSKDGGHSRTTYQTPQTNPHCKLFFFGHQHNPKFLQHTGFSHALVTSLHIKPTSNPISRNAILQSTCFEELLLTAVLCTAVAAANNQSSNLEKL